MMVASPFLPYGRQNLDEDDSAAVIDVLRSDYLTTGPKVAEFEALAAETVGAPFAVACGNGTQALHLATAALGFGANDWVIVPSITFLATANAVRYVGAEVVFADVDPKTGLMTVEDALRAEARAPGPIKGIMPVHLGGLPSNPEEIGELAHQRGWQIIEDGSHAIGTSYLTSSGTREQIGDARNCDACTMSFHPVKTVTTGEGGLVTTRDSAIADKMRRLRSHGMTHDPMLIQNRALGFDSRGNPNPWYYEMAELGFNYRLPDILCALGISQLRRLRKFIEIRANLVQLYCEKLSPLADVVRPITAQAGSSPGWHLFRVLIDFSSLGLERSIVMASLRSLGIGSQVHYIPVSLQPYYVNRYGHNELPGAFQYYNQVLSLPLHPGMNECDVDRAVGALRIALSC